MTFIEEIKLKANLSPAINNKFYSLWLDSALDVVRVEIILANYFARTLNTVSRVCDVVSSIIDPIRIIKDPRYSLAVINNLENLQDELGSTNKKSHVILLAEWINVFLKKLGSNHLPIEDHYQKFLTEETINFCNIQKNIYRDESVHVVVGASLAQELFADHMMKQLYNGYVKNYSYLFDFPEELKESEKYFLVHNDGTEEKHGDLISELVLLICKNQDDIKKINYSYDIFEKITFDFWQGIYNKISNVR